MPSAAGAAAAGERRTTCSRSPLAAAAWPRRVHPASTLVCRFPILAGYIIASAEHSAKEKPMRAEAEKLNQAIRDSLELLRRHL